MIEYVSTESQAGLFMPPYERTVAQGMFEQKKTERFFQKLFILSLKIVDKNKILWYYLKACVAYICGCSSMVEFQPSKLAAWVRFPSPAPILKRR